MNRVPPGVGRSVWTETDLDQIASNYQRIRAHLGPEVQVMGVVKANAYGHGALAVAHRLVQEGVQSLGVAIAGEGVELRQGGIQAPILILGASAPEEAPVILERDLTATLTSMELAQALRRAARERGERARVHIKVDTGMGRLGLSPGEVLPFLQEISQWSELQIEGIFTHLATADEADKSYAHEQLDLFDQVLGQLAEHGLRPQWVHAANSAACLDLPRSHYTLVRPGLLLYGYYPSQEVSHSIEVSPCLSWRAQASHIKQVPPGTGLSYGRTYITSHQATIATVPVGYADGYLRVYGERGEVLIGGQRHPIRGRVCMDQFMVEVKGEVPSGCVVTLLGCDGKEEISAEEMASWSGTISYEVVSSISSRVPRAYRWGGLWVDEMGSPLQPKG